RGTGAVPHVHDDVVSLCGVHGAPWGRHVDLAARDAVRLGDLPRLLEEGSERGAAEAGVHRGTGAVDADGGLVAAAGDPDFVGVRALDDGLEAVTDPGAVAPEAGLQDGAAALRGDDRGEVAAVREDRPPALHRLAGVVGVVRGDRVAEDEHGAVARLRGGGRGGGGQQCQGRDSQGREYGVDAVHVLLLLWVGGLAWYQRTPRKAPCATRATGTGRRRRSTDRAWWQAYPPSLLRRRCRCRPARSSPGRSRKPPPAKNPRDPTPWAASVWGRGWSPM